MQLNPRHRSRLARSPPRALRPRSPWPHQRPNQRPQALPRWYTFSPPQWYVLPPPLTVVIKRVCNKRGVWHTPLCGTLSRCGGRSINVFSGPSTGLRLHLQQPPARHRQAHMRTAGRGVKIRSLAGQGRGGECITAMAKFGGSVRRWPASRRGACRHRPRCFPGRPVAGGYPFLERGALLNRIRHQAQRHKRPARPGWRVWGQG